MGLTGHHSQALAACERAIEIEPRQAVFWPQAIIAALQADNASRAAELTTRALELFPDHADLHYADSCALVALGRLAEAEASIRRAVSLAPETRLFKRYLALVLVRGEQWDEAQQLLLGLDSESPAEAGLSESLAHVQGHIALRELRAATTAGPDATTRVLQDDLSRDGERGMTDT